MAMRRGSLGHQEGSWTRSGGVLPAIRSGGAGDQERPCTRSGALLQAIRKHPRGVIYRRSFALISAPSSAARLLATSTASMSVLRRAPLSSV